MGFIFFVLAVIFLIQWLSLKKKHQRSQDELSKIKSQLKDTESERDNLKEQYSEIIDAEDAASKIKLEAASILESAKEERASANAEAKRIISEAQETAQNSVAKIRLEAENALNFANKEKAFAESEAKRIISDAETKAQEIAGEAYAAMGKAKEYEKYAQAMKRTIEGYGDEWLKPSYSLLDELAADFSYTDAGQKLKSARARTAQMVKAGQAANCDYAESYRRITAIQFVIDAFNGKVDSLLSKVKQDNYGILAQKIKDSYELVNKNGSAFRNAHILPEYLNARLDELKWAVIVQELKAKAAEEQRALREKMREEEKARREYERAQKEAEKEEAMLKKAMEKAKALLADANNEQKAKYEAQLKELEEKLSAAEEKNQRALSMAQQTKRGTVYVISNIGSFGENVYKVGMTRRLDPLDRVRELGDASVPFSFDVHAFIESEDAPALETELHKSLALMQMNKVNPRKEFFRVDLSIIKAIIEKKGLNANWTMLADAAEYRESLAIEERIKNDPNEKARWEQYVSTLTSEATLSEESD